MDKSLGLGLWGCWILVQALHSLTVYYGMNCVHQTVVLTTYPEIVFVTIFGDKVFQGSLASFKAKWGHCVCMCAGVLSYFSCVQLFAALWTASCQAALSMGLFRQEYWSGLPCPILRNLSDPGFKPAFLRSPALATGFFTTSTTWEALMRSLGGPNSIWLMSSEEISTYRYKGTRRRWPSANPGERPQKKPTLPTPLS